MIEAEMDLALINTAANKQPVLHEELLTRFNSQTQIDVETSKRRNNFASCRTLTDLQCKANIRSDSSNPRLLGDDLLGESFINDFYVTHTDEYDPVNIEKNISNLITEINSCLIANLNTHVSLTNKKPEPVMVEIYLIFLKISEIDTIKERFRAEAFIESHWIDNDVDPNMQFNPTANWNPEIRIENGIGDLKEDIRYKVFRKPDNNIEVHEMRMVRGVFWERLELWDFPLDLQELSITVSTSRDSNEIIFESDPHQSSTISTSDFMSQQEWTLYSRIETSKKVINDLYKNCVRPCFTATAFVGRKPGYFLYNAYMLIFLVSVLGFVPFSFSISNIQFRIQVTSLLILTSVNFRWIVTQRIPNVSYLTTLDKYAIGALIFLVVLCAWHSIIGSSMIYDNDIVNKQRVDAVALYVLAFAYVIYHIIHFVIFYMKYRRNEKLGILNTGHTMTRLTANNLNKIKSLVNEKDRSTTKIIQKDISVSSIRV